MYIEEGFSDMVNKHNDVHDVNALFGRLSRWQTRRTLRLYYGWAMPRENE